MANEKKYAVVIDVQKGMSIVEVDKFKIDCFTHDIVEGYFEAVPIKELGESKNLILLLNEEGKMRGLPLNPWATMLSIHGKLNWFNCIVGNVVIFRQSGTELEPFTKEEASDIIITIERGLPYGE